MQGSGGHRLQQSLQMLRLLSQRYASTSQLTESVAPEISPAAKGIEALRQRLAKGAHSRSPCGDYSINYIFIASGNRLDKGMPEQCRV
jgi:hypothetical protein